MTSQKPRSSQSRRAALLELAARVQSRVHDHSRFLQYVPFVGTGWRTLIATGTGTAITVLVLNIALLVWGSTKPWDPFTSTRTLSQGDCNEMQNTLTYSHLYINIISTVLLGTSNAAMQCLSAPTREEVRSGNPLE